MTTVDAPLRAVLRRPFPEQIAAFRLRLGDLVPTQAWGDLWQGANDRAFMVAGAMKADLLADLALAIDKAIAQGTSLEEFRRDFRAAVVRRGWHGWTGEGTRAGEAWRTRVIYQTNMRTSYAAGRMAQLREAGFRYWIYRHGGSREPRVLHLAIDGLILPADHPFWSIWAPPNGWGCSCWVAGAHTLRAAQRRGGNPDLPPPEGWDQINPATGAPEGIDRGWAYSPGASASDTITAAAQKVAALPAGLGEDLTRSLDAVIDMAWPVWIEEVRRGRAVRPALVGALDASVRSAIDPARQGVPAAIQIARSAVPTASPPFETANDGVWPVLPARLRRPLAILRDEAAGVLIYVVEGRGDDRIAVTVSQPDETGPARVLSVNPVLMPELLARLAAGVIGLIAGALS